MTEELCRSKFEEWWEKSFGYKPIEGWDKLYIYKHDYYLDEGIDGAYDVWKAAWNARAKQDGNHDTSN